ncbi:hypothetical protein FQA39_LY09203 [Lamprigera yunnana]|nr:hypothetical protein FQA39_LY09203 [Lamprigera yunnana]
MYFKISMCIIGVIFNCCDSAKILAIVPTPSYSHQVTFHPLWKELSLRGHQVTLATTDPIKDPNLVNLTEIDLSHSYSIWNEKLIEITTSNFLKSIWLMIESFHVISEYQLSHPLVQELIKNDTNSFDLVMVEFSKFSYIAFGGRFKCPIIIVTSLDMFSYLGHIIGNPTHPIVYPDQLMMSTETLFGRVTTILMNGLFYALQIFYIYPLEQGLIDKHFGTDYPPIDDMLSNTSLVLTNSDPIFHKVRPLLPSVIQIGGGVHRTSTKPLPKEIKTVLDSAEKGFIYFSLGSNVKSKDLKEETRNIILETFAELPYTVLWKFELENLPNKPSNVLTSKWLPQPEVLNHRNIKLFITQGGLQSMDEAIYSHIPMVGVPFFADQDFNIDKMVKKGFGLSVDYRTLKKEDFKETILEVINNPKYKSRVKKLAELALDQPMTSLEKAVWWTEYVIRTKGARHLRSPLLDIPTYQYYLLDVIAVFATVIVAAISLFIVVIKCLLKVFSKKTKLKVN